MLKFWKKSENPGSVQAETPAETPPRSTQVSTAMSKPTPASAPKKNITAVLRDWHKRAGLVACFFLAWLACTGVVLTRSNELGLDVARVDWDWLMSMYHLKAEPPKSGFTGGTHWLAATKDYTVLDGKPLAERIDGVLGVVAGGTKDAPLLYVASSEYVFLLDIGGARVDQLSSPILPLSTLRRIGAVKHKPGVIAIQDLDAYQSADEGNSWAPVNPADVDWSVPSTLDQAQRQKLLAYSRPTILVEQLLIDLHTGRLFGPVGAWIITLMGLLALWLATSGVWMWYRINQNRKRAQMPPPKRPPAAV